MRISKILGDRAPVCISYVKELDKDGNQVWADRRVDVSLLGPPPSWVGRDECELILTTKQQARIADVPSADILGLARELTLEEWKSLALNLADLLIQAGLKLSVSPAFGVRPKKDETKKSKAGKPLLWAPNILSAVRKTIDEIKHNSVEVEALRRELEFVRECKGTEALIIEFEDSLRSKKKPLTNIAAAQILIDRWAETNSLRMRKAVRNLCAKNICVALSKAKGK